MYADLLW
jgi:acetyl esterase/lipase